MSYLTTFYHNCYFILFDFLVWLKFVFISLIFWDSWKFRLAVPRDTEDMDLNHALEGDNSLMIRENKFILTLEIINLSPGSQIAISLSRPLLYNTSFYAESSVISKKWSEGGQWYWMQEESNIEGHTETRSNSFIHSLIQFIYSLN